LLSRDVGEDSDKPKSEIEEVYAFDDAQLKRDQDEDPDLKLIINFLEDGRLPKNHQAARKLTLNKEAFAMLNGILHYVGFPGKKRQTGRRIAVPRALVRDVLYDCHDSILAAHLGFDRTLAKVQERYWWNGLYTEVRDYVRECPDCMRNKFGRTADMGEPQSIVVSEPWAKTGIDYVGPLKPTKRGNRYIVVLRDYMSGWAETMATTNCTADCTVDFLVTVIHRHGSTLELVSNNGPAFIAQLYKSFCKRVGTTNIMVSSYHPEANGLVERWNATLIQMLRFFVDRQRDDWDVFLSAVTFAFNTSLSPVTNSTPFEMLHGRKARLPTTIGADEDWKTLARHNKDMLENLEAGKALARDTREQLKQYAERHYRSKKRDVRLEPGDLVYIKVQPGKDYSKLDNLYDGPFTVIRQSGLNTFVVKKYGEYVTVHIKFLKIVKGKKQRVETILLPEDFDLSKWEELEPPLDIEPKELVGSYVLIWWPQFRRWYPGRVTGMQGRRHLVTYFERSKDTPEGEDETYGEMLIGYNLLAFY
jgi:transposase InsO family protein